MKQQPKSNTLSDIPVFILAGGLATRLRPLTETIPKSLVEVEGLPFIDFQLRYLAQQGIVRIVLCLGYLGKMVQDYVGDGSRWGLQVDYSFDGEKLVGTGGALAQALKFYQSEISTEIFFVLYGDSFLPIDFQNIFESYKSSAKPHLMTVFKNENSFDKSNVQFDSHSGIQVYSKKPSHDKMLYIDYGLEILHKQLFDNIDDGKVIDLADLLSAAVENGQVEGFEVKQRFYEIGTPSGLLDFKQFICRKMIVLDRDGVLNAMTVEAATGLPDSPMNVGEVKILEGVAEAILEFNKLGYEIAIATNQPAAAKGKSSPHALQEVHDLVVHLAQANGGHIKSSHICWHRHEDHCPCRKPKPYLVLQALGGLFSPKKSWMVGDRVTDLEAGRGAGVQVAWICNKEQQSKSNSNNSSFDEIKKSLHPEFIGSSLIEFAEFLKNQQENL